MRPLGRVGVPVSEVGLGCEHLENQPYEEVERVIEAALAEGINIFDLFMPSPTIRTHVGQVLGRRREKVLLQGHIGSVRRDGQYARSRDTALCEEFFRDCVERCGGVDIGVIHFVDTDEDLDVVMDGPYWRLIERLRAEGAFKYLGMSSHVASVAKRAVESGRLDVLMFSINPAFDLYPANTNTDAFWSLLEKTGEVPTSGFASDRAALYAACVTCGTAITVMKSLGAGFLLNNDTVFDRAMTVPQCIQYALDRPAVASVLVGCRSVEEVKTAVSHQNTPQEELDYAFLAGRDGRRARGRCVYCNHCLPCPAGIDVAAVTRYLDLAGAGGGASVAAHYATLGAGASHCTKCGACEGRCPFAVPVRANMDRAAVLFGY